MLYILPASVAVMACYMAWLLVFRLRRDRILTDRERTRGKHAFRPRERARLLLNKAFGITEQPSEWERDLLANIDRAPGSRQPPKESADRSAA